MTRAMKDSGLQWIGDIPEDWEIVRLGSVLKERNEKVSTEEYKPLSVTKSGIVPQLDDVAKSSNPNDRKKVIKGDFVINSRSDRKQSCGLSSIDGSVSLINIVLKLERISGNYTKYLLDNYRFAEEFYRWGTGIVDDLWSTRYEKMKRIMTPLPLKSEQKAIADFLDKKVSEIDNIISKTKKVIEEYKKYKQSLITEVVTKGLDKTSPMKDSGIEWIGEIPEHWEVMRLKDMGSIYRGTADKNIKSDELPVKLIQYTDIYYNRRLYSYYDGFLDITVTPNEYKVAKVKKGDLLLTTSSEVLDDIGRSCVVMDKFNNHVIGSDTLKIRIQDNIINIDYKEYLIENYIYLQKFASMSRGITRYRFNMSDFKCLKYPIPPLQEQKAIASYLDQKCNQIDQIINSKQQLLIEMGKYKKSLIYEAVTGKKEVE